MPLKNLAAQPASFFLQGPLFFFIKTIETTTSPSYRFYDLRRNWVSKTFSDDLMVNILRRHAVFTAFSGGKFELIMTKLEASYIHYC